MFGAPDRDVRSNWKGEFSTGLTPAETERLAILAEECGEVVQLVAKILRHGYGSHNPNDASRTTNRQLLEREMGDVSHAVHMLLEAGDVDELEVIRHRRAKVDKIARYLHHQPSR